MRGFTLLEVLIALLVVSITLAAANAAIGGTASRERTLEDRTFATWAAHSALVQLRLDGFAGQSTQVERTEGGRRLRVHVKVEPGDGVREATLTVRAADGPAGDVLARVTGFLPLPVTDAPASPPSASDNTAAPAAGDRPGDGAGPDPNLAQ